MCRVPEVQHGPTLLLLPTPAADAQGRDLMAEAQQQLEVWLDAERQRREPELQQLRQRLAFKTGKNWIQPVEMI